MAANGELAVESPRARGKVFCDDCGFWVTPSGHEERCQVKLPQQPWVHKAAWLGDAFLHAHVKTLVVQTGKKVVDDARYVRIVSNEALRAFMDETPPSIVSIDLEKRGSSAHGCGDLVEAAYFVSPTYRWRFLYRAFPNVDVRRQVSDFSLHLAARSLTEWGLLGGEPSPLISGYCYLCAFDNYGDTIAAARYLRSTPSYGQVVAYIRNNKVPSVPKRYHSRKFPDGSYHLTLGSIGSDYKDHGVVKFDELGFNLSALVGWDQDDDDGLGQVGDPTSSVKEYDGYVWLADVIDDIIAHGVGGELYRSYWIMLRGVYVEYSELVGHRFRILSSDYATFVRETGMEYRYMLSLVFSLLRQIAAKTYNIKQLEYVTLNDASLDVTGFTNVPKGVLSSTSPFVALPTNVIAAVTPGLVSAIDGIGGLISQSIQRGTANVSVVRKTATRAVKAKI